MRKIIKRATTLNNSEDAVAATEYAVLLSLIIIVSMGAIYTLGTKIGNLWVHITGNLPGMF